MKYDPRAARNVALMILAPTVVVGSFFAFNLRINLTDSHVPVGIWKASSPVSVGVGDIIKYDRDEFFSAFPQVREERMIFGTSAIIKRVAAMPGALVELSGDIVIIGGRLYEGARILNDSWRKIEYPLRIPEGMVWLMADTERAYDSRYHGPVPCGMIQEKLKPVLIW